MAAFTSDKNDLHEYIGIKLASLGFPLNGPFHDHRLIQIASPLLRNVAEKNRLFVDYLCPADQRIQDFLDAYLSDIPAQASRRLPNQTFILDQAGLGRMLSLPPDQDQHVSDLVSSYRIKQGVLHNPRNDRRTTQGVFHIAEGGFAIPDDKIAVPKAVFARLLEAAFQPPKSLMVLPFTATSKEPSEVFVSLYMRPIVCPEAGPLSAQKSLETRFFVPGSLVSNLDFVESIFGNAGDPTLEANDAALDVNHWTGHTGCVILAPHLTKLTKKALGLPSFDKATDRQKRDGMCWKKEDELYNNGGAFKITARDHRGVMFTIIADNYFGYCKKEIKTQISYAANMLGLCEEEHAGGALAYASYILGQDFYVAGSLLGKQPAFEHTLSTLKGMVDAKPEGYAVDKRFPSIYYVPGNSVFSVRTQTVSWETAGKKTQIKLLPNLTYILPSGYKIRMEKQTGGPSWRLVGTTAEGTFCHKPFTVSGGGKSEISKSIANAMQIGPVFVRDFHKDFDEVEAVINKDYRDIFQDEAKRKDPRASRPILSLERSLGSVIRLLTPSPEYTDSYNEWLKKLPNTIRQIVFTVKRYYRPEWGQDWRSHFHVEKVNGFLGHELRFDNNRLVASYLRIGFDEEGAWRIFKLRPDFYAAEKVQMEDDISASVVVPASIGAAQPSDPRPSVKLALNCESMLFQRPDDAVVRGFDKQAEADIAAPNTFLSNFEPMTRDQAMTMMEQVVDFEAFTEPMKNLILDVANDTRVNYFVSSSNARLVDGKPSKNPRYLQPRPDRVQAKDTYVASVGVRLARGLKADQPVYHPINSVLASRRNNPPEPAINLPALAVYNPIHYQELPELFMDFICSLTGKSPSTTGFGSEGALTKGPFNALWPVVDLNNAILSFILTGYDGYTTAAGHCGPTIQIDHDISLLIPEIWCRLTPAERDPKALIQSGCLEKLEDFEYKGETIRASRLGYRITKVFVERFLGRIFEVPSMVFTENILKPETQGMDMYVEGVKSVEEGQKRVAEGYFRDGSVDAACPPLKALIHIMAKGTYEGKDINHPDVRKLFDRETVLASAWYQERLKIAQEKQVALAQRQLGALKKAQTKSSSNGHTERIATAEKQLAWVKSADYRKLLIGTIGADPFLLQITASK